MARPDKKQRHKAKRQAKQQMKRRQQGMGPLKRLADAPGEIECWMSDGFEEMNQAQIFVYKRAAGLSGIAAFLVDRGVVGVKDAYTQMGVDRGELTDMIERCGSRGIRMRRASVEEVRRRIAGGLRWAYENGMRLPKEWVKTASLLGGVGDWGSADVSTFVKEFAGHPEDLRQRLIGEPFESYIQRKDIAFTFGKAPYLDQQSGKYVSPDLEPDDLDEEELGDMPPLPMKDLDQMMQSLTPSATKLAATTVAWLTALDRSPSPQLMDAWRHVLLSRLLAKSAMPEQSEDMIADFADNLLWEMAAAGDQATFNERSRAIDQALNHLKAHPRLMADAVADAIAAHRASGEASDFPRLSC